MCFYSFDIQILKRIKIALLRHGEVQIFFEVGETDKIDRNNIKPVRTGLN